MLSLEQTLRHLCRASRVTGSDWNRQIGDHLAAEFAALGYLTEVEESTFTGWELDEEPSLQFLTPARRKPARCLPVVWSGSTNGPVSGTIRRNFRGVPPTIQTFEAYEWTVYPVADENNVLVACLLGGPEAWPQPRDNDQDHTPYLMLSPQDAKFVQGCLDGGTPVSVKLTVRSRYVPGKTVRNIVARRGAQPSVLVCAHYDSFFSTTGFHDNASGVATLLALAQRIGTDITFVAFDAEEWNKLGSYRFVEKRLQSGELSNIGKVLNLDSVAVGDALYIATTASVAADATLAARRAKTAVPLWLQPLEGMAQFDTWPFVQAGVPAVQIGSTGGKPFRDWHQPGDNLDLFNQQTSTLIEGVLSFAESLIEVWTD